MDFQIHYQNNASDEHDASIFSLNRINFYTFMCDKVLNLSFS